MIRKIKEIFRPMYVPLFEAYAVFAASQRKYMRKIRSQKDSKKILKYKNKHLGERCFIIGNGPSLKTEDLEKLNNEICFASHRIYYVFDKTKWRPTYYCAQDLKLISQSSSEINDLIHCPKFLAFDLQNDTKMIRNAIYTNIIFEEFYPNLPKFSEDMYHGFFEGYTVTYMCLQMAIYMGFKEIILLGIDHNYSMNKMPDGTISHLDVKDHFSEKDDITNIPQTYKSTLAYIASAEYATKNKITILNATRGGKLDVFKRIDFDELNFREV